MSELEEKLLFQIRAVGLQVPERQFRFNQKRRWKFDFAWPDRMIAVEVEGGIYARGNKLCPTCKRPPVSGHTSMSGFEKDCEKYNNATMMGWNIFRFTVKTINSGEAVTFIENVLKSEG